MTYFDKMNWKRNDKGVGWQMFLRYKVKYYCIYTLVYNMYTHVQMLF